MQPPTTNIRRSLAFAILAIGLGFLTACSSIVPCRGVPALLGKTREERIHQALEHCQKHWAGAVAGKKLDLIGYDLACRTLLCELRGQGKPKEWRALVNEGKPVTASSEEWDLERMDDIVPAVEKESHRDHGGLLGEGIGVPVLAKMDYRATAAVRAKLFPLHGRCLPATLVVDCGDAKKPILRIFDTLKVRKPKLGGIERELAVDFYSPLRQTLAQGLFGEFFSIPRLFQPERGLEEVGIYSLTPYRKGAIPLVFVHGLVSDPTTWLESMRAVWSDPELAKRYQIWYFLYPTGLPIPESAARLRESLAAARQVYDPKHLDPAMDKMVMVGHSMGGVLSRWQMVDSGNTIWDAFYPGTTPETVPMEAKVRDTLKRHLVFKANPSIAEAIFVASPHRGSKTANKVGDLIVRFIKLPFDLTGVALSIAMLDPKMLNPVLRQYRNSGLTSLETLRADWPATAAMDKLSIRVPHHSIIARIKTAGLLEETTDGAVPYSSSHLTTAKSEKIVHAWHSCCNQPEVVAEIVRILKIR